MGMQGSINHLTDILQQLLVTVEDKEAVGRQIAIKYCKKMMQTYQCQLKLLLCIFLLIQNFQLLQMYIHKPWIRRCDMLLLNHYLCQNAGILLDNRRGMDLRMNNNFRNSDGKMGMGLLCLVDGWGLGLSL